MITHTDSHCSLRVIPRMNEVGVSFGCDGQCTSSTTLQNNLCGNLYNEFGIQQCYQANCSPRTYNLGECASEANINRTTATPTTPNDPFTQPEPSRSGDGDDFTNGLTTDQSQTCTPTTVYKTVTASCTTTPTTIPTSSTSTTNMLSALAALGALVGLLVILLVIVTAVLIWTCWKLKTKRESKSLLRQSR